MDQLIARTVTLLEGSNTGPRYFLAHDPEDILQMSTQRGSNEKKDPQLFPAALSVITQVQGNDLSTRLDKKEQQKYENLKQ